MISASVHGKTGDMVLAISHPEYIDFNVRMPSVTTSEGLINLDNENYAAPTIAGLNGKTAIEAYPELARTLADIMAKHPEREDGKGAIQTLLEISRPHPEARIVIIGAEHVPRHVRYIEVATRPRFFASAKTASGDRGYRIVDGVVYVRLEDGWRRSTEAIRQNAVDVDAGDVIKLGPKWEEISGAALLQREIRIQPTGGGSKSKNKKSEGQSTQAERNERTRRRLQDDSDEPSRPVRLAAVVHDVVTEEPQSKIVFAALARAIQSGTSYKTVLAAIEKCQPGGTPQT